MMVLVSVVLQLLMKILENAVLGHLQAVICRCWKRCCSRRKTVVIFSDVTFAGSGIVGHLYNCSHIKKAIEENKCKYNICAECKTIFDKQFNAKVMEQLEELA